MKKSSQLCFICCFLLVLIAVPLMIFLRSSKNTVSFYENRSLEAVPQLNQDSFLSGQYFNDWESWLSNHMAGRSTLLKLKTYLDMNVLGRPVVNGEVVSADVLLPYYSAQRWDLSYLDPLADKQADDLAALDGLISSYGGQFYYLGLPHQSYYFADHYPDYLSSRKWHVDGMTEAFASALETRGVRFLDMAQVYAQQGSPADYYSPTDHHFTYYGALEAYRYVLETINQETDLGLSILSGETLRLTQLPNPYLGSQNRKLYDLWPNDETLVIGSPVMEIPFTRYDNGIQVASSLFDIPDSDSQLITYNVYMGGDVAETVIRTDRPELPSLLIFGDSFTNPLETLLYTAFNETRCLDLRYYTDRSIRDYILDYQPDIVLCVRDNTAYLTAEGNGNIGA